MLDIGYASHSFHSFHEETPTIHEHEGESGDTDHPSYHSIIRGPSYHGTDHLDQNDNGGGLVNVITVVLILVGWYWLMKGHHKQQ